MFVIYVWEKLKSWLEKNKRRSLLNKMIQDEAVVPVTEDVKPEPKPVKQVDDIIKRYMESQSELMEMITTLFIRLEKFKEI